MAKSSRIRPENSIPRLAHTNNLMFDKAHKQVDYCDSVIRLTESA